MEKFKFNLGSEVKDRITGFKGVIRASCKYLTGCDRYAIQSQKLDKEGDVQDWRWFDENELVLMKDKKITLVDEKPKYKTRKPGGPLNKNHYAPR